MELSFVLSALRRRFWLVTLFALLGALPGLRAEEPVSNQYQSTAELYIQQPTQGGVTFFSVDPDRYVVGQLSVLSSASLANDVRCSLDRSRGLATSEACPSTEDQPNPIGPSTVSFLELREATTIEQEPSTDVVRITVEYPDAEIAYGLADGYVKSYMATLETDLSDEVELSRLDEEIERLTTRLTNLNIRISESMEPYLDDLRRNDPPPPVPAPEVVDPDAVSQKNLAEAELRQLQAARNNLVSDSRLRVNTRIIQDATLPTDTLPVGGGFLLAGGLFAGFMLGVVAALAWARFSTKVLDEESASEILGAPVVSDFPHYRSLARQPLSAFQALPRSAVPIVDQLCVRAEAKASIDSPLTVVVVGTQRGAGSTTLALAMAGRFASAGSSVVVVDADVRDPRITAIFNATRDGGVSAVVENDGALIDQRGRSVFTRTMDPEVSVLGLGSNRGGSSLRRDTVASVLEAARRKAKVVVIDGGPVLDLASTIQLTALADAVVMAMPLSRQKSDVLSDLSRQLGDVRNKILPVITSPARRPAKGEIVGGDGLVSMAVGDMPPVTPASDAPTMSRTEVPISVDSAPGTAADVPAFDSETVVYGGQSGSPSNPPGPGGV